MSVPQYEVGLYLGSVVSQAMGETSKGNTQFVLTCNIIGKIDQSEPDTLRSCKQGQRTVFMVFTDKTIDFLLEQLQSIGFNKPSFSYLDPSRPDHQSFVNQEIELWCAHREYEGNIRENWSISTGGGGLNLKPAAPASIRKLDSLYDKKLKALAKDAPKASPAQQNATAAVDEHSMEDENSIPF